MFNFQIIEPQHQKDGENIINLILKKLIPLEKKNDIFDHHHEVAFIVAESKVKGILGGACLRKKNLTAIQEDVKELIKTPSLYIEGVWECSNLCVEIAEGFLQPGASNAEKDPQVFYEKLYDKLVEFGLKKDIGFVVMKLTRDVYLSTKKVGLWPYIIELKPENSYDGLFHGVLPLSGAQYENYKKRSDSASRDLK